MATLRVRVKPGSRETRLDRQADGSWLAQVKALPVDGKANAELIALIARHFGVTRSAVSLRSGAGGRYKRIDVED